MHLPLVIKISTVVVLLVFAIIFIRANSAVKCPNCGKRLKEKETKMFGIDWKISTFGIPNQCPECGYTIKEESIKKKEIVDKSIDRVKSQKNEILAIKRFISFGFDWGIPTYFFLIYLPKGTKVVGLFESAIFYFLLQVFHHLVMETSEFKGTIGKNAVNIRLVNKEGSKLTLYTAIKRFCLKLVLIASIFGALACMLSIFFDPQKSFLDEWSNTRIERHKNSFFNF